MCMTCANPHKFFSVENQNVDNFFEITENREKLVFYLDFIRFFGIIEMVFFRIEEVDKHENDISAK